MNNTTTTRTLAIAIVLVAAAAVITGTYAATATQQASASSAAPCSHLKAIKGGKIACASNEQKAKIDQQQSANDENDDGSSHYAKDKGSSKDKNNEDSDFDVTQSETASISQDANATASIG